MSEKTLVVQHNNIVEARYKLTVEEQRLVKTLVSQIQSKDEDFKAYEIRILDLVKLLGITQDYYYHKIKKLTKKLRESSLCFINEMGDEVQTGWLSSAIYRRGKGTVELRFDPVLKPYLLQLKRFFTSYELGNILRLKGMYSIRIYELLKQYEKIGKREFTLNNLKQTLKIDSEYSQYRDFKKFVLIPAENEISEKTDIKYTVAEIKRGRKVIGLIFDIKPNKTQVNTLAAKGNVQAKVTTNQSSIDRLMNFGVTRKTAESIVADYDEERIQAAIAYTESQLKDGKLKNPAGFVVKAIEEVYRDNQAEERERQEAIQKQVKAREEKAKHWEGLKNSYREAKEAAFQVWLPTLPEEVVTEERKKYLATLDPMLQRRESIAERAFYGHMQNNMPFASLAEWLQHVGVSVEDFSEELQREAREKALIASSLGIVA